MGILVEKRLKNFGPLIESDPLFPLPTDGPRKAKQKRMDFNTLWNLTTNAWTGEEPSEPNPDRQNVRLSKGEAVVQARRKSKRLEAQLQAFVRRMVKYGMLERVRDYPDMGDCKAFTVVKLSHPYHLGGGVDEWI